MTDDARSTRDRAACTMADDQASVQSQTPGRPAGTRPEPPEGGMGHVLTAPVGSTTGSSGSVSTEKSIEVRLLVGVKMVSGVAPDGTPDPLSPNNRLPR